MRRWIARWITLLSAGLIGIAQAAPDSPPETALADYVAKPDPSFEWRVQARFSVSGAEVTELLLQSQTWRDTAWKHRLYLIKPEELEADPRQGLLVIGGGRWREHYERATEAALPDESDVFVELANRLGTIVAVLGQVPFQPMFDLTEDRLIAYTFVQYLATGDAEWPLLLPMVKSAVRAMDAAQAHAAEEWGTTLERFTVLGGSKRGWTTWLTGAVEPRAAVLVPLVIDALNFPAHVPYQTEVWGAPSRELAPYAESGLLDILATPDGDKLRRIVDPYSYRAELTQPKLVVVATNDAYFPVESMNHYWSELPEPKHALYLPNEGHNAEDLGRLVPALAAIHRSRVRDEPMPALVWEYEPRGGRMRLCLRAEPAPTVATAWTAESADRDFRNAQFEPAPITLRDGVFVFELAPPAEGFKAVFAESLFGEGDERYTLSTNLRVIDSAGRPASDATAIAGTPGVCP